MSDTKKIIILVSVGIGIALLALLFLLGNFGRSKAPQQVTLQFWGVYDSRDFYATAINDFNKLHPNIRVIYKQFNFEDYEKQLLDSFAADTGPDIWLMHNTWLPKHFDKIQPLSETISSQKEPLFTFKDFQDQFVDVALQDLTAGGKIYALPIYIDTLGLYYNKDIFNTAGIANPPKTWDEFVQDVRRLTTVDSQNNIVKSAVALGTSQNINRSTDILSLLMLQSGAQMTDPNNLSATFANSIQNQAVGENALQFYTDFANPNKQNYTWNDQQHYSIDAFSNGETAMMLNYSHQVPVLRAKSARFNFGIAPVPQPAGAATDISYANYWATTVSKKSQHPEEAWQFLVFLSSNQGAVDYLNIAGRPAARRDLIDRQKSDPDLGPFAAQVLTARSWFQSDNNTVEKVFADMIDNVNFGRASVTDAIKTAQSQISVLMSKSQSIK